MVDDMLQRFTLILSLTLLSLLFNTIYATPVTPTNHIHVITVSGDDYDMGVQYGKALKDTLNQTLAILENFYEKKLFYTHQQLVDQTQLLYQRFPAALQQTIQGEASGAGMSLDDAIILNGMETIPEVQHKALEHCTFSFLSPTLSQTHHAIIGRNYDYGPPFNQITANLTVTIFKKTGSIPTATIALPGELYCPNCVNKDGIFLELNSGSPSGGSSVNDKNPSLLSTLLTTNETDQTLQQTQNTLNNSLTDFSLIINAADAQKVLSFEYSSSLGMMQTIPALDTNFVSTNYFLNPYWKSIPKPNDINTWMGVTRRNNQLQLMQQKSAYSIDDVKHYMDQTIAEGGAKWDATIYQIIYDPATMQLLLKTPTMNIWQTVELTPLFNGKVS